MIDQNEGMNIIFCLQKYMSLYFIWKGIEISVVWERETKTHRGHEGLRHCYIDPYLLNSTVPHSDSKLYVFPSLTRHSHLDFVRGHLAPCIHSRTQRLKTADGRLDWRLITDYYCCELPPALGQHSAAILHDWLLLWGTCVYIIS